MTFATLGLSDALVQAVEAKGYDTPSPIQQQAIPVVLQGKDLMAAAQTGTGKTAGFTLPILELLSRGQSAKSNRARALILTPTRELAAQVGQSVVDYGQHMKLRSTVVFGGVKINPQMMALRKGADILVATPGRLLDLHQQNAVRFDDLEILVLDEADRMLDMGFIHDIKKILNLLPKKRQNLLFSATFSSDIRNLAKGLMNDPEEISVSPRNTTATTVKQVMHPVDKAQKPEVLIELIKTCDWHQVLVFSRTKHGANRLAKKLDGSGIRAAAIHGNKSQAARLRALDEFKRGKVQVLVATDIAARGLDISQLPHVVNFDLPNVAEDYVHRIGRTGRAGAEGEAVSLVSADEIKQLQQIEQLIGKSLPREYVDGFEPNHEVPASQRIRQPHKPKAKTGPKKPSQRRGGGNRSGGNASANQNGGNNSKSGNRGNGNPRGNSSGQAPAKRKPRPPRARRAD